MEKTHKRICRLCNNPYTECWKVAAFCYKTEDHILGICTVCYNKMRAKGMSICDGCGKPRRDIQTIGHDSNGDPDGPDYCFICRKENERGKYFDRKQDKYVYGYGF